MAGLEKGLWAEYRQNKGDKVTRELVLRYLPLVNYVVSRLTLKLPPHIDLEDLAGYGFFGLMDAIRKFDPKRGVKFETYAFQRIRGSILDEVRRSSWVPRNVTDKIKLVAQAYEKLEREDGKLSEEAVAEETGLTIEEVKQAQLDASHLAVVSLEQLLLKGEENEELTLEGTVADGRTPDPVEVFSQKELRETLKKAIQFLGEKDRVVLSLSYYEELTLKEISEVLGVSESRVCQLRGRALIRLRQKLINYL